MSIYQQQSLAPMLLTSGDLFGDDEYIYEIKYDGIRAIIYLDSATTIRTRNGEDFSDRFPEFASLHNQLGSKMIIDGEIVVFKDGRPDFPALQPRIATRNKWRREFLSQALPANLVVFDILYLGNKNLMALPLSTRRKTLERVVTSTNQTIISPQCDDAHLLYRFAQEKNLEGIVAKRLDSHYYPGVRTTDWVKIKIPHRAILLIGGYRVNSNGALSLILARKDKERLIYATAVSAPLKTREIFITRSDPLFDFPTKVTWVEPTHLAQISFTQELTNNKYRHPRLDTIIKI